MKVGHETPINGTAARVMAPGESFEYSIPDTLADSSTPLPVRNPSNTELGQPSFVDLKGKKFGRLSVVGISVDVKARWVCRCVCGQYVRRSAKVVKASAPDACCEKCRLLAVAKKAEYFRRTGKHREMEYFL